MKREREREEKIFFVSLVNFEGLARRIFGGRGEGGWGLEEVTNWV